MKVVTINASGGAGTYKKKLDNKFNYHNHKLKIIHKLMNYSEENYNYNSLEIAKMLRLPRPDDIEEQIYSLLTLSDAAFVYTFVHKFYLYEPLYVIMCEIYAHLEYFYKEQIKYFCAEQNILFDENAELFSDQYISKLYDMPAKTQPLISAINRWDRDVQCPITKIRLLLNCPLGLIWDLIKDKKYVAAQTKKIAGLNFAGLNFTKPTIQLPAKKDTALDDPVTLAAAVKKILCRIDNHKNNFVRYEKYYAKCGLAYSLLLAQIAGICAG